MKTFGGIIAALVAVVFLPGTTEADMVDFELDGNGNPIVAGQIIDDEFAALGLTVSTLNLTGGAQWGIIFDTNNPTGGDSDLETPNPSGIGNAAGVDLGNSLIISEGGVDTSPADGIQDNPPDDEGTKPAGRFTFTWDYPVQSLGFHLIDIEANEELQGYTMAFMSGGAVLGSFNFATLGVRDPSITYGDNSVNWVTPISATEFGGDWFDQVEVFFNGSGSIDTLTWQRVPEPSSLLLFGAGLGILTIARRRRF